MKFNENLCLGADFDEQNCSNKMAGSEQRRASTHSLKKERSSSKANFRTDRERTFRNPYVNFVVDFCRSTKLKGGETFKRCAEAWRRLDDEQKSRYIEQAKRAPKRKQRKLIHSYPNRRRRTKRHHHHHHHHSRVAEDSGSECY